MKEKHIFAGNNTSEGFFSYFDHLLKPEEADHIYILKGGPGVGKNYFMKKIGEKMAENNLFIEYIHCSSDDLSLDGLVIPELKLFFVDGTDPHIIDPVLPGAIDEIINLGAFLDVHKLNKHKNTIIQTNKAKSNLYESAYRYLRAAGIIYDEISSIYDLYVDSDKFNQMCEKALSMLFTYSKGTKEGSVRKMFTEAFTAKGYISYTDLFFEENEVWAIAGNDTNYSSVFLDRILKEAVKKGYRAECCYRPLSPKKLQHLYLPEKKLIIVTAETPIHVKYDKVFDINGIMDVDGIRTHISEIERNLHLYGMLINNALDKLSETKKLHDILEVIYSNSMDFDAAEEVMEKYLGSHSLQDKMAGIIS
ncbi:MAG: hypothetical protein QM227_06595 [Bacillota bacterium]|jgi:hypothetical protein|nr:hypothetical protein [Bacillota bacterium]NLL60058.1 hypothetical protein [Tissierellia bacterium]